MRIVDLSVPLRTGMEVYPGDPEVEIEVVQTREEHGWEVRRMAMGSHTGTHVDAFSHAHAGGNNLDGIPLDRFYGEAVCVSNDGELPTGVGLIFRDHVSGDRTRNIDEAQPPFIGGPSLDEALERELLGAEIVTFDGLVNLDQLPTDRSFTFCGFPLRIASGDGSPVRAVAILA